MTKAEKKIWYDYLSKHDLTFHRQKIINHYIVDFYNSQTQLVIEIDGDTHFTDDGIEYDKLRDSVLSSYNLTTLRFTNKDILENLDNVIDIIETYLKNNPPNPL